MIGLMEPDVSIGFGHKVTRSSSLERQLAVMQQAPGSSAFLLLQAWPRPVSIPIRAPTASSVSAMRFAVILII